MSVVTQGKRITFKRRRPNPLFQEWLEDLYEEAKTRKSKQEAVLKEALESLSKYPLPLQTGAECAVLIGFNKKICSFLDNRLQEYHASLNSVKSKETLKDVSISNKEYLKNSNKSDTSNSECEEVIPIIDDLLDKPTTATTAISPIAKVTEIDLNFREPSNSQQIDNKTDSSQSKKKAKGCKEYKPAFRSGGYAILVALLEHYNESPENQGLSKEELILKAQAHSDESFTRPKPESFYTAWSNMSRLVTKDLVKKNKNKKIFYSLSTKGVALANELIKENKDTPTLNDIIFNEVAPSNSQNMLSKQQDRNQYCLVIDEDDSEQSDETPEIGTQIKEAFELPSNSFDIILLIDKNETSGQSNKNDPTIAQFNKYPHLKHEYRSLKVSDFIWIARSKTDIQKELVLPYAIERKRMDDLGASIKDGRFHEQKFRLKKSGLKHVTYLIENFGSNKHVGLPILSLMQALANTRVQDGFKVHMTSSLTNTVRFLAMMTKRLTIEYEKQNLLGVNSEPDGEQLMTFTYFNIASAKTKPLTVTETFIKLLLQLKGISVEKALAITKLYRTPKALIEAYQECDQKQGEMLLANLKFNEISRNVGPSVSKSIYQLLSNKDLM